MKKGYLSKTTCASHYCPTMQALLDRATSKAATVEELASIRIAINKDDMCCDATGTYWCHACAARCALMNYGASHGYPALSFPPYAVGAGQTLWRTLAGLGMPACIEAWMRALGLDGQEEEGAA
jgi:hypothetical protein